MKTIVLAILVCLAALAAEAPAPRIDFELQFRVRTLEARYLQLEVQIKTAQLEQEQLKGQVSAKQEELKKACGDTFQPALSPTGEYVCVPVPKDKKSQ